MTERSGSERRLTDDIEDEPFVATADETETAWFLGGLFAVTASDETTDGSFGVVDATVPPGFETPLHVHHREDELVSVLAGELACYFDGGWHRAGPSDTVFLPRGAPHGVRAVGEDPVRMLVHVTPPGFERFVVDAGEPATDRRLPFPDETTEPSVARLSAVARLYGLDLLGPLPTE
ncbi:cupin domain-containing protein [Haloferacaceae archaeon DSL9]